MSKPVLAPARIRALAVIGILAATAWAPGAAGQQNMRNVQVIPTPSSLSGPDGARESRTAAEIAAARYPEVDRAVVKAAIERIVGSWGDGQLMQYLAPDFRGDIELVRNVVSAAPADARLRLLSLQSFYTVSQTLGTHPRLGAVVVSEVAATAMIQIELTNPFTGEFVRADGRNDLLLRISRKIVPIGAESAR